MTLSIARQIVLVARPQGTPQLPDFLLEETAIPTPAAGQLLLGVQYLSLDPYMRGRMDDRKSYATPLQLGEVMTGETVAQVLTSNHPAYAEGDLVLAPTGWRTHGLSDGTGLRPLDPAVVPVTTGLGVLGMPGFTAYAGVRLIGKPLKYHKSSAFASVSHPRLTPQLSPPSAWKRLHVCQRVATVPGQPTQTFAAPMEQACACGPARRLAGRLPSSPAAGGEG